MGGAKSALHQVAFNLHHRQCHIRSYTVYALPPRPAVTLWPTAFLVNAE